MLNFRKEIKRENRFEKGPRPKIFEVIEKMESAKNEDKMRELVSDFFDEIKNFNIEFMPDVSSLYREMENKRDFVRLEQLKRAMEAIINRKPIYIGDKEDYYANAVIPNNEGLKIAFAEGGAPGPVRLLIGFDVKSAIGFNPKNLAVSNIKPNEFDLRNQFARSAVCKHVSGELKPEALEYFIMRVPRHLFPEKLLNKEEMEENSKFIFRGARLKKQE